MLRRRQQGFGKPIISILHNSVRFVAVGKRLFYSQRWLYFTDFLLHYLKSSFGSEWGSRASKTIPEHPLFRWLDRLQQAYRIGPDKPILISGYISALNRLAYALYLIEHNDKPSKSLLRRLRLPETFDPACYEAIVEAAFALAGASIEGAEDRRSSNRKPEFFATFKSGERYAVEAKRKASWKTPFDFDSEEFAGELKAWLRGRVYAASEKKLMKPVYWFELSIGERLTDDDAEKLRKLVGDAIEDAETITVDRKPPQPAYVVVTNNADFANDDASDIRQFALLMGFRMDDFRDGYVELETAMEHHDRHRPIRRVLECLIEVQQVPVSFAGVPDELLDEKRIPIDTLKIGNRISYPRKDGSQGIGKITEITSGSEEAWAAVHDESLDEHCLIKIPLTKQEAKAAQKFGDAIFGKPDGPHENITDPLRIYDRMLEIHANYTRASLLKQLESHPLIDDFKKLSDGGLRIRVAREMTKRIASMGNRNEPPQTGVSAMPAQVVLKSGKEATAKERAAFEQLVLCDPQVSPDGLSGRIARAHVLAFLYDGSKLIGTGAIKRNPNHQAHVADDSGIPLPKAEFLGEVGYLHTAEGYRRRGHGDQVLRSLIDAGQGKELFATIQSKNEPSQRLLGRHGYVRVGKAWRSEQADDDVSLYIRPKPALSSQA